MAGIFSNYSGLVNTAILPIYPNVGSLPATSIDGSCAITLDTHDLYIYNAGVPGWVSSGGSGFVNVLGPVGAAPNANAGLITGNTLVLEPADATHPGVVTALTQTFGGNKVFAANLSCQLSLQMNQAGTSAATSAISTGANDGELDICSGTGPGADGGIIRVYGHSHASRADRIEFYNTNVLSLIVDASNNVRTGNGAINTTATNGFLYVASCAGTPTGVPTSITGMVPMVVDTSTGTGKLWFYVGGAWKGVLLT